MKETKLLKIKLQGLLHKVLPLRAKLDIDVLIVSYPRSGQTWFRCMLADYLYGGVDLSNLEEHIPALGDNLWKNVTINNKICGSHAEPRIKQLTDAKIIYIYRNRSDILKSYCKAFNWRYKVSLSLSTFSKWMDKWYSYPMPSRKFFYEWSKIADYGITYPFNIGQMSDVIDYLGYTKEDHFERLKKVYAKFSKENMIIMQAKLTAKNFSIIT